MSPTKGMMIPNINKNWYGGAPTEVFQGPQVDCHNHYCVSADSFVSYLEEGFQGTRNSDILTAAIVITLQEY